MRRSISALGGALIALALAAGPAWAGSPGQDSVTQSAAVGTPASALAALASAAGGLPLTGLRVWMPIAAGAWLVASGLALLLAGSFFRGAHARRREEDGGFVR
jgi:hypothetical protein